MAQTAKGLASTENRRSGDDRLSQWFVLSLMS